MAPAMKGEDEGEVPRCPPENFSPGKKRLQIVKLKMWLHVVFVKPASEVA